MLSLFYSQISLFLLLLRRLVMTFRAHLDDTCSSPHFKLLNHICGVPPPPLFFFFKTI
jgi:hypothetical protein